MQSHYDIQQILKGGDQQLGELLNSINSAPLALRTSTADRFFARIFIRNPLHAAWEPLLAGLNTCFVNQVCQNDQFYCDATHPMRLLLDCLIERARTWYPRETKLNQLFFSKLSHIIQLAARPEKSSSLSSALAEFCSWDDAEGKRATMLEMRLCESELNYLKMLSLECRVLDLINEALTGRHLPLIAIELIPLSLKNELQHCAVAAGSDSPFWKLWQRLLPLIAEVFASDTLQTREQQLYRHIPAMLHELERSLDMDIGNPQQYQQLVEGLSQALIQAIQKQPAPLAPMDMLPYPAGHSDARTRATDSVLQQGAAMQQGDWILFSSEDRQIIRCKLALKNAITDQLLFVDRSGRKVMIKSSKDFSLCLSAGIATHLIRTPLTDIISELITALVTLHTNNLHKQTTATHKLEAAASVVIDDLQQQTKPAAQRYTEEYIRDQQQIRALEFAERRRITAEKTLAEAKALTEEKIARALASAGAEQQHQTLQAAQKIEQLQQQLLRAAEQQINGLNVGAWVERLDAQQQTQRCKLAVYIAAAGKYIFVDTLGRKVVEYQREQLVEVFVAKQLTIINNGDKFEDQLVKVIRSLRKDISQ